MKNDYVQYEFNVGKMNRTKSIYPSFPKNKRKS